MKQCKSYTRVKSKPRIRFTKSKSKCFQVLFERSSVQCGARIGKNTVPRSRGGYAERTFAELEPRAWHDHVVVRGRYPIQQTM